MMILIILACLALGLVVLYKQFKKPSLKEYFESHGLECFEGEYGGSGVEQAYTAAKARGKKHIAIGQRGADRWSYIPVDSELLKSILLKDFGSFMNHGTGIDTKANPLNHNLFHMENEEWKYWRTKLSPTFTSGKMKMMFQTMVDTTTGLYDVLKEQSDLGGPIDIKEYLSRFTTDIISSCAFGIEANCLKNPEAEIRMIGREYFNAVKKFTPSRGLLATLKALLFKRVLVPPHVKEFFIDLVSSTIRYREENNIYRKDFMHMMLQLKNIGQVTDDDRIKDGGKVGNKLSLIDIMGHSFIFFIAGFETSTTLMTFAVFELAYNQDIQDKLRAEIQEAEKAHGGKLSYEMIMGMTYLDKVIQESLRRHPPIIMTMRKCNKDWQVPGEDLVLKAGTPVMIPITSVQMDPEYYPDPEKFDPERFSSENKSKRPTYSFMPFGEGPRICIGMRFGIQQSKVGLYTILKNFKITLNKKTKLPLEVDKFLLASVKGGVWVNLEKL